MGRERGEGRGAGVSKGGEARVGWGGGSRSHPRSQKASPDYIDYLAPLPPNVNGEYLIQGYRLFSFHLLVILPHHFPHHSSLLWFGGESRCRYRQASGLSSPLMTALVKAFPLFGYSLCLLSAAPLLFL